VSRDNIIHLIQPANVEDQLTEILRNGARALLAQSVDAEVADFLGKHTDLKTSDGHQRVVRHDHLPEREVMTGIGPVAVRQPRVRDREADVTCPDRIRFSPSILPPYMRRYRDAAADPLPEGDLDRRLLRGAGGTARPRTLPGCRHPPSAA
jgi:putative transposase